MPKSCPKGLSQTDKGYCRTIGFYRNGRGQRVPRKFWLGHDRTYALRQVRSLSNAWDELPGERGEKVWTDDAIAAALSPAYAVPTQPVITAQAEPLPVPAVLAKPLVSNPPPISAMTLPMALDEFSQFIAERNDIGRYHRDGTKSRIASIKQHVEEIVAEQNGTKLYLKDLPLAAMDMEWLSRIRNKITSRPMTRHAYDTQKPISIDCVKNWLMTLGMAFDWFDLTPRIGWRAPHARWRSKFTLNKKQEYALRTPEERDTEGKPKPAFTLDEVSKLYKNAVPLERLYLLMGVFLGWSQEGISSFRRPHLVRMNGELYIDRRRGKTGVDGYWWVCPELATRLTKAIAETPANEDDLALLTEDGNPLVHGKSDSIRLAWDRCLGHAPAGVRLLPFGRLKKFGSQVIRNLGGLEMSQLFLAHRSATVAAEHYAGDDVKVGVGESPFEQLHGFQKRMYAALTPHLFNRDANRDR